MNPILSRALKNTSALLFLSATAFAQEQRPLPAPELLTYRTRAQSLKKTVEDLSAKIGQKLAVSNKLSREIVLVNVHDVPVNEFLKKLADTTSSDWVNDNGILYLERTSEKLKSLRTVQIAKRQPIIRKWLNSITTRMTNKSLPSHKLLNGIIEQLDAGRLAQLTTDRRFVFSSAPNANQLSFGFSMMPLIKQFCRAESLSRGQTISLNDIYKVILVYRYNSSSDKPEFSLSVFGQKGNLLGLGNWSGDEHIDQSIQDLKGKTPLEIKPTDELDDNDLQSEAATTDAKADKAAVANFLSKYDVLESAPSTLALATAGNKNTIVYFPDDLTFWSLDEDEELTVENVLSAALKIGNVEIDRTDNWQIIRPTDPTAVLENRYNRAALRQLLRNAKMHGYPTLDDIGNYVAENPPGILNVNPSLWLAAMAGVDEPMEYTAQENELRFYNSLTPATQNILMNGDTVSLRNIGPATYKILTDMIFQRDEAAWTLLNGSSVDSIPDIFQEPTETFPNGLPSDAVISLSANVQGVLLQYDKDGDFIVEDDAEELGYKIMVAQKTGRDYELSERLYRADIQKQLAYKIIFPNGLVYNMSVLKENRHLPMKPVPWQQINDKDIKAALQKGMQKYNNYNSEPEPVNNRPFVP